tara:strand:- start:1631 stop:1834 length:204 start_codon:yes stop_codon:yes gene_type:complete
MIEPSNYQKCWALKLHDGFMMSDESGDNGDPDPGGIGDQEFTIDKIYRKAYKAARDEIGFHEKLTNE